MCTVGEVMRVAVPSAIKAKARCEEEFEPYEPKREVTVALVAEAFVGEEREKLARRAPSATKHSALSRRQEDCCPVTRWISRPRY